MPWCDEGHKWLTVATDICDQCVPDTSMTRSDSLSCAALDHQSATPLQTKFQYGLSLRFWFSCIVLLVSTLAKILHQFLACRQSYQVFSLNVCR